MKVKNIVKLACTYLQLNHLLDTVPLDGNVVPTSDNAKEIELLVSCVNLTNSIVASEFIKLKKSVKLLTDNGKISFSDFEPDLILDLVSVKDKWGNAVVYKVFSDHIKTVTGEVEVIFNFQPKTVSLSDEISHFNLKVSERVLAYGVATEFCFIKSLYDDATVWDNRFRTSLILSASKRGETKIRKRRWL